MSRNWIGVAVTAMAAVAGLTSPAWAQVPEKPTAASRFDPLETFAPIVERVLSKPKKTVYEVRK